MSAGTGTCCWKGRGGRRQQHRFAANVGSVVNNCGGVCHDAPFTLLGQLRMLLWAMRQHAHPRPQLSLARTLSPNSNSLEDVPKELCVSDLRLVIHPACALLYARLQGAAAGARSRAVQHLQRRQSRTQVRAGKPHQHTHTHTICVVAVAWQRPMRGRGAGQKRGRRHPGAA